MSGNRWYFIPPSGFTVDALYEFDQVIQQWWTEPGGLHAPPQTWMSQGSVWFASLLSLIPTSLPTPIELVAKVLKLVEGSDNGPGVPPNAAVRFELETASSFRRSNGRFFLSGLSQTFLSGTARNEVSSTNAPDIEATFNGLPAFLADAYAPAPPPEWVVWLRSRQTGGRGAMPVTAPVERVRLRSRVLTSMRLRSPGQLPYDVTPDAAARRGDVL